MRSFCRTLVDQRVEQRRGCRSASSARLRIARCNAALTSTITVGDCHGAGDPRRHTSGRLRARGDRDRGRPARSAPARGHVGVKSTPASPATVCPRRSCRDRATRTSDRASTGVCPSTASDAASREKASPEPAGLIAGRLAKGQDDGAHELEVRQRPSVIDDARGASRALHRLPRIGAGGGNGDGAARAGRSSFQGSRQTPRAAGTSRLLEVAAPIEARLAPRDPSNPTTPSKRPPTDAIFRSSNVTALAANLARRRQVGEARCRERGRAPRGWRCRDRAALTAAGARVATADVASRAGRRCGGEKRHQPIEIQRLARSIEASPCVGPGSTSLPRQ